MLVARAVRIRYEVEDGVGVLAVGVPACQSRGVPSAVVPGGPGRDASE